MLVCQIAQFWALLFLKKVLEDVAHQFSSATKQWKLPLFSHLKPRLCFSFLIIFVYCYVMSLSSCFLESDSAGLHLRPGEPDPIPQLWFGKSHEAWHRCKNNFFWAVFPSNPCLMMAKTHSYDCRTIKVVNSWHTIMALCRKKSHVPPQVPCVQHRKSLNVSGNVVTGNTDSINALSSLLGRVPFCNDGVIGWHALMGLQRKTVTHVLTGRD